ncbi:MAG: hypothetical protein ACYCYA_14210, partial [Actinomycetes bacterium]
MSATPEALVARPPAPSSGAGEGLADQPASWRTAWLGELDRMEMTIAEAEALLRSGQAPAPTGWQAPERIGPLPEDLEPRAQAILGRQLDLAAELTEAIIGNRQHSQLIGR